MKKGRGKKKEVVLHQHVDKRGKVFGYPHSVEEKHTKESTVKAHNRTVVS